MARPRLNLSDEERRERRNAANRERKRRQASEDPEYRAKQAAYMRRLRADRSEYRAREARAKRERRLNDPGLRVVESYLRQVRRCEANGRRKSLSSDSGHGCHVCGRLGSDANLSTLSAVLDRGKRRNAAQLPQADRSDDNNKTLAQEHESEEVICGIDTFNADSQSESSCSAFINSEIALLVPKREPEEIVQVGGNVGPGSPERKTEVLGIKTEGSNCPSLLGPPCKCLFDPSH
ncbi:hypothetical protein MRX96_038853 [Rhipicephalus microplus]